MLKTQLQVLHFLLLPLLWLGVTLVVNTGLAYLLILVVVSVNLRLLAQPLHYRRLLYFSLSLVPALIAMLLSSYFFGAPLTAPGLNAWGLTPQLQQSLHLSLRLYTLAMVSFSFVCHMPQQEVILTLLQWRLLPLKIGFALLAVFNAFSYLAQEFQRIQLAYQMRYQRRLLTPRIILPLLVAAARYAHNLNISIYTRGLNNQRSYYYQAPAFSLCDYLLWLINLSLVAAILSFNYG